MADRVEVIGADRLAATLAAASRDLENTRDADARAGQVVQTRGRANAPKRTGRLAGSIQVRPDREGVAIGSSLIYAPVIHNGWHAHNIRPNPFLSTALEESVPEVASIYADDVGKTLARVKGA